MNFSVRETKKEKKGEKSEQENEVKKKEENLN